MYSNEASMASGNGNGEVVSHVARPTSMEEASAKLVPQALAQPIPPLFDGPRTFVHAPQYHWHAGDVTRVDVALRERFIEVL